MGHVDRERLTRLLGDQDLAWVLRRVRRRLELGRSLSGTVTRRTATTGERDAVALLLGRPPRAGGGTSISLDELDELLRRSGAHSGGLAAAVVELTGPVTVRADAEAAEARAWAQAFRGIDAAVAGRPALAAWLDRIRASGALKRRVDGSPADGQELLDALARVIVALPATPGESLSAFAARVIGRAHALDAGSPLDTLAIGAARALAGLEPPAPGESPTEGRREAWAAVGVLCDELSSTVLTLGLIGEGEPTGRILAAAAASSEPVWLTLRQLVRAMPRWDAAGPVLVVENPSVVSLAADAFGGRAPAIVCTNGQPRAAAMVLLRSLASAGLRLLHHGDFDWSGVAIGNLLHRRLSIQPWQFDANSYVRAVAEHPQAGRLDGSPVTATWDPDLAQAMSRANRRIEEELVTTELLENVIGATAAFDGVDSRDDQPGES